MHFSYNKSTSFTNQIAELTDDSPSQLQKEPIQSLLDKCTVNFKICIWFPTNPSAEQPLRWTTSTQLLKICQGAPCCLLSYTGVFWHFFCRFVPGSKTSWLALLITLAYHSDVYFLIVFTMVSLWRTKPCTRNGPSIETLILRIWCIPYLQTNFKRQS